MLVIKHVDWFAIQRACNLRGAGGGWEGGGVLYQKEVVGVEGEGGSGRNRGDTKCVGKG